MPEIKKIMSINVANVTIDEAVLYTNELISKNEPSYIITPNAEIAQKANEESKFADIINNAGLVVPDGIGVVLASKILNKPLTGKVAGVELAKALLASIANTDKKVVFFGSGEGIAKEAKENILKEIPGINIIAEISGFFDDTDSMIEKLRLLDADVIFVCLGSPKQEYFMAKAVKELSHGVMLGLGGTLDVFAGRVKRAPSFFVKFNLEWLYRIAKQPKRIGRAMKLPKYIIYAVMYKLKGK